MSSYVTKTTPGDTSWFTADRFGMFIHLGLFSMPARHEWVKSYELLSEEKYEQYFKFFNPDLYDPKEWAKQAKAAGMKYAVLTTKHHEGFCLFDSKYTDYKVTNTEYGKDIVKEYVEAFRAEGLKVGLYYSLIDWHHPEFPIDWIHPRRCDEDAEQQNEGRDIKKYAEYMRNQITELLTNYGKIDILWFDFSYTRRPQEIDPKTNMWLPKDWMHGKGKDEWESEKLIKLIRELQPGIIINNRADIEQDIWGPEQCVPMQWLKHKETGELVTWEVCHTFSGSWGYHRDEMTWKSPKMLIDILINTVCYGGNLIMNVGPTSRGYFDARAEKALAEYAKWMKYNSRSIYNCTKAEPEFVEPRGCRLTQSQDGKRLYIHLMEYPFAFLELPGFAGKVEYVQFLHDGSELLFTEDVIERLNVAQNTGKKDLLTIHIPPTQPDVLVPVVEIFLK